MNDKQPEIFSYLYKGELDKIKSLLIDGYDIDTKDRGGRSILIYSIADKQFSITKELIKLGADVNLQDKDGRSPLHAAAQIQKPKFVELLIKNGAKVDIQDNNGNTPLSDALFYSKGIGDTINEFLKHNADPYLKNKHGVSPYDLAQTVANYDLKKFFKKVTLDSI